MIETAYPILLIVTTLCCSLVAGFLFAFAVVVMPGFRNLSDRDFIRAFQVTDRIIQDNQPLFLLVWVGSILLMLLSAISGFWYLDGWGSVMMVAAAALYLVGVQALTIMRNLPLNAKIQSVNVDAIDDATAAKTRRAFEREWNYWNGIRTPVACVASALLMVVMLLV